MSTNEEKAYWARLLEDLQGVMTVADIAADIDVELRQVWRWKAGERRPMGMAAVKVYLLHVKRCPDRQRLPGQIAEEEHST